MWGIGPWGGGDGHMAPPFFHPCTHLYIKKGHGLVQRTLPKYVQTTWYNTLSDGSLNNMNHIWLMQLEMMLKILFQIKEVPSLGWYSWNHEAWEAWFWTQHIYTSIQHQDLIIIPYWPLRSKNRVQRLFWTRILILGPFVTTPYMKGCLDHGRQSLPKAM